MDQTEGIVTRQEGTRFWVEVEGREVACLLRGRLKQERARVTSPLVVGDAVRVALQADGGGTVEEIRPRRSELVRPGFKGLAHVIAANVDRLVIVQAAGEPPFKRGLVERFLATARRGRMEALLVVNKCDLQAEAVIRSWLAPLAASECPVLLTSVPTGQGLSELRSALDGRISVLAGQSGVGKSSLLNALYPGMDARVGEVSQALNKGRHTTTGSRLYCLPEGGYLADTPGIRTLALYEDAEAVADVFPEIEAARTGCRFRDCTHSHEARCAVRAAVERGDIRPERYESYLRLSGG